MKASYAIVFGTLFALMVHTAQATTFTIHNKSDHMIEVCPTWPGRPEIYDALNPGQSQRYDSGFNKIRSIIWKRSYIDSNLNNISCVSKYTRNINAAVATLDNHFEIYNDGNCYSKFLGGDNGAGNASVYEHICQPH